MKALLCILIMPDEIIAGVNENNLRLKGVFLAESEVIAAMDEICIGLT
ncbi:MAG: hypothetical protein SFY80_04225 [Verrucomicrobiota bacterium]|nr:hypothetical protein [Verrucomicrobiota bacterium]